MFKLIYEYFMYGSLGNKWEVVYINEYGLQNHRIEM